VCRERGRERKKKWRVTGVRVFQREREREQKTTTSGKSMKDERKYTTSTS
jgi:hypothetical protein